MTTICFVGPSAYVPIHSAMTLFPEDFAERITKRPIRALIPVAAADLSGTLTPLSRADRETVGVSRD
jgi:NADH-quinone oxidoreductase subunit F